MADSDESSTESGASSWNEPAEKKALQMSMIRALGIPVPARFEDDFQSTPGSTPASPSDLSEVHVCDDSGASDGGETPGQSGDGERRRPIQRDPDSDNPNVFIGAEVEMDDAEWEIEMETWVPSSASTFTPCQDITPPTSDDDSWQSWRSPSPKPSETEALPVCFEPSDATVQELPTEKIEPDSKRARVMDPS